MKIQTTDQSRVQSTPLNLPPPLPESSSPQTASPAPRTERNSGDVGNQLDLQGTTGNGADQARRKNPIIGGALIPGGDPFKPVADPLDSIKKPPVSVGDSE